MKFTPVLFVLGLAGIASAAQCTIAGSTRENCCWGGDNGMDACLRKVKTQRCTIGIEDENFCRNLGIGSDRCDADCCDTITGWGVRCPG